MTAPATTSSNTPAIHPAKAREEHLESALLIATDAWTSRIGGSVPIPELGSYDGRRQHAYIRGRPAHATEGLTDRLPTGRLLLICYLC
jgi:hypothetical protein